MHCITFRCFFFMHRLVPCSSSKYWTEYDWLQCVTVFGKDGLGLSLGWWDPFNTLKWPFNSFSEGLDVTVIFLLVFGTTTLHAQLGSEPRARTQSHFCLQGVGQIGPNRTNKCIQMPQMATRIQAAKSEELAMPRFTTRIETFGHKQKHAVKSWECKWARRTKADWDGLGRPSPWKNTLTIFNWHIDIAILASAPGPIFLPGPQICPVIKQ